MSQIVQSNIGRFRRVTGSTSGAEWLLEMPCGDWEPLSNEQLDGAVSVNHAASCKAVPNCGFHETRQFGADLVAAMRANLLFKGNPIEEDDG